ncbi:Rrf2 family transcriptional regulator [Xanthobacter sp. V4C-4]|uniref:RrF2 family transcriptional regulator n=1 Tax=Xanthobacter cornucopiae TaxID=3119924 RepID=UPI0037266C15
MLTKKGKYGLKAVAYLAALPVGQTAQVGEVAEAKRIPKKFLDVILGDLRKAGLLLSRKGKSGGYRLADLPEKLIVGDVIRALDGPLAPLQCASKRAYEACEDCDAATCNVRLLMSEVREAIGTVLDTYTLADLRDLSNDQLTSFVDYI